ncbi:hypothetical protein ACIO6T_30845 [Streptomyces sp. NPDC087532]|uniref:hypothetical protein n=1 Tax=Streptomyces sp. NPDC087532 TaxID=3365795 RepID=UPI003807210A
MGPDAIYKALVAMGVAPVMHPELWPNGPQDEGRARLVGCLLAKAELELATTPRTGAGDNEPAAPATRA